jgi:hypothetical protein
MPTTRKVFRKGKQTPSKVSISKIKEHLLDEAHQKARK